MKKIVLSLAGVMAAVAFAPEASALPVFARQTGMACSACHFQHFPALNGFGRAFKASGYTMMGAQGKVEGEHLSIPDRLNMAVLTTQGIEKQSGNAAGTQLDLPSSGGELSLFYGGRISENAGFLSELGLMGAATTGAAKLVLMYPMGSAKVGVSLYTGGQGAAHSMELLNTGAAATHRMVAMPGIGGQHINVNSAAQYLGTKTNASGVHVVATTDNVFANVGVFALTGPGTQVSAGTSATGVAAKSQYIRVAGMFDVAGFDSAVGIQNFSGGVVGAPTKATIIDGQMQGEVSGMPAGFYASYGTAPATAGNVFNVGFNAAALVPGAAAGTAATSLNLAAEVGVLPGVATVQFALRRGKNGAGNGVDGDNAWLIGATYELAQNIELSLTHTRQSGSYWNTTNAANNAAGLGKNATSMKLEALF